jgi:RNA polymerase sigma-70 factor (ECF subfamily)
MVASNILANSGRAARPGDRLKPEAGLSRSDGAMEGLRGPPPRRAPAPGDEEALIARARGGDSAAFRALVGMYQDRAYGLALRILRSPADAEEVAQDAFVRAWRSLPQFRGDARFSTWLYRIVARRAFDASAKLRRRREREVELDAIDRLGDGDATHAASENRPGIGHDPLAAVEAAAPREALETMIASLPEMYRAVVTLHYFEDRSIAEIAGALDTPEGTVKTHLFRARAKLRELWLGARASRVVP